MLFVKFVFLTVREPYSASVVIDCVVRVFCNLCFVCLFALCLFVTFVLESYSAWDWLSKSFGMFQVE